MKHSVKTFLLAGALAVGAAAGASAATLDFTDYGAYSAGSQTSTTNAYGFIGSVRWDLTATGGPLNATTTAEAPVGNPLKLDNDGVGVGVNDDEVTNDAETLELAFSKTITLTGVHVLDLFVGTNNANAEAALAYDADTAGLIVTVNAVDTLGAATGGYAFKSTNYDVKNITFKAGGRADDPTRTFDFALAAIDYKSTDGNEPDPVPLPAGGVLLLGALGGLALTRRRKA